MEEIRAELERRAAAPQEQRRRFHLLPGGLAVGSAVAAGGDVMRRHPLGVSISTAAIGLALLAPWVAPLPAEQPIAAPPQGALPPVIGEQPERDAPPPKRRRFPPPRAESDVAEARAVESGASTQPTTSAPPRPAEPPASEEPRPSTPSGPEPEPEQSPTDDERCLRMVVSPPEVDVELEQCIDAIVGYLAAA